MEKQRLKKALFSLERVIQALRIVVNSVGSEASQTWVQILAPAVGLGPQISLTLIVSTYLAAVPGTEYAPSKCWLNSEPQFPKSRQ